MLPFELRAFWGLCITLIPSCENIGCFVRWKGTAPMPPVSGVDEPDAVWGLDMGDGDSRPVTCSNLGGKSGLPAGGDTGHEMFLGVWASLEIWDGKKC